LPAFWTPDKQTIAACQKTDLIILNGSSAGFKDDYIKRPTP
jgi:hypothetical protein